LARRHGRGFIDTLADTRSSRRGKLCAVRSLSGSPPEGHGRTPAVREAVPAVPFEQAGQVPSVGIGDVARILNAMRGNPCGSGTTRSVC